MKVGVFQQDENLWKDSKDLMKRKIYDCKTRVEKMSIWPTSLLEKKWKTLPFLEIGRRKD